MIIEIMNRWPKTYTHIREQFAEQGGTPEGADFFMAGLCLLRPLWFVRGVEDDLTDGVAHDQLDELNRLIKNAIANQEIEL